MTREELFKLAAEKAVKELSWDSIEWLFQPRTALELLLRLDFHGMISKIKQWLEQPQDMFVVHQVQQVVRFEEFYREMRQCIAHEELELSLS